jgi:hypothetical protein
MDRKDRLFLICAIDPSAILLISFLVIENADTVIFVILPFPLITGII